MAGHRERTQTVEAVEINEFVLPWLKAHYQEDFFLFVHYWDPHVDSVWGQEEPRQRYLPPEEYAGLYYEVTPQKLDSREYVISQYDAEITYADKCIGDVLNLVEELGIADETLVVFQSDHGENLGEDHPLGRAIWDHLDVHEPTIRIPLIIRYPGLEGGKAIGGLVRNVDISATILSYAQVPVPDVYDGQDLAPLIQGTSSTRYAEVYSNQGFMTCKRALITKDGWKLIKSVDNRPYEDAPTTELYDLNRDPGEVNNLASVETGRLADLELRMARWLEQVLGNRPDPLRLRAHMGMLGPDGPYYGTTHQPRTDKRIYTATPE
jgi:arylsulfatase A-like enzyme